MIVRWSEGEYVCAFLPMSDGFQGGWVRREQVAFQAPRRPPALSAWRGWWRDRPNVILLDPRPGRELLVSGRAFWQGQNSPHFGDISTVAKPQGDRIEAWGDDDVRDPDTSCEVILTLLGRYLLVADNLHCGGANVSFTGVYRRFTPKTTHKPPR